jgi:hypothetical protein
MPRPTKYSDEKAAAICKAIENGNTFRVAALVNGIALSTLNLWREKFPAFSDAINTAEALAEKDFVNDVVFASRKGDWNAAKFWLTHRNGDDWRPPKETKEVTGKDGAALTVKVLKGVSMDDL